MELTLQNKIDKIKIWLGVGSINIFGMLLSGKDTQSKLLAQDLSGHLISGGDILRNQVIPENDSQTMQVGNLIDQQDYLKIITPYLSRPEFDNKPLILSAVGRWIGEEQTILSAAAKANHPIKAVVYIKINNQTAFDRLSGAQRNRPDDNAKVLKQRIKEFSLKTLPVIKVYQELSLLLEVNGEQTVERVYEDIINELYEKSYTQTS